MACPGSSAKPTFGARRRDRCCEDGTEEEGTMRSRLRCCSIAACLFVFLFVVVGAGLHLKPLGAFLAALSGSFLVIHGVNRWSAGPARIEREDGRG